MVLVYAIVRAEHNGWASATTLGLGAVAVALLVAFIAVEARIRGPLVRLDIFKVRTLAVANLVLLLVAAGLFALFFFASLYVQRILGFSPIEAGLAFLPVTAGILVGSVTAQAGVKRFGAQANTLVGMVIAAVGLFLLAGVPVEGGSYWSDLLPGLVLMAFGMGNTFVPITLIATCGVEAEDAGLASGHLQHVPAGGRRARARRALHARGERDHELPAEPRPPARAGRGVGGAGGGLSGRLHGGGDPGRGRSGPDGAPAPAARRC